MSRWNSYPFLQDDFAGRLLIALHMSAPGDATGEILALGVLFTAIF